MSNLVCPECGSSNIQTERRPDGFCYCPDCRHRWKIGESQPKPTVFDRITQSPEVLAEKLVYYTNVRKKKPLYDWKRRQIANRWFLCGIWKSSVTNETYSTKSEAIAATVAQLKEVAE